VLPKEEWPELVAEKIYDSQVFLSFLSRNSIKDTRCIREVNFAFKKNKAVIGIEMDEVDMSLGLELQFSDSQLIYGYMHDSVEQTIRETLTAKEIKECYGGFGEKETSLEIIESEHKNSWIVRVKNNDVVELNQDIIRLGRSNDQVEYTIGGNSTIGRVHARLIVRDGKCYIIDNKSMNKTYLNNKELLPEKEYLLNNLDVIRLSNESFEFHQGE